jgi:hypothetical protein
MNCTVGFNESLDITLLIVKLNRTLDGFSDIK